MTAILAPRLERGSLRQALYDRCCCATAGARILLDFRVNGRPMGGEICG